MPGGKIVYVPLQPPKEGGIKTASASEWTIDFDRLEAAVTPKTKMLVINTPRKRCQTVGLSPIADSICR